MTLADLRRYAVARSLFVARDLQHALDTFGFVQADPIQAPARAQDLVLRHRVPGYVAGDLERRYPQLDVEEDFFINYGFVTPRVHALMHPRTVSARWTPTKRRRAAAVLDFIRTLGQAHPRQVDEQFDHGRATNYWGGSSNATTMLLDGMHYRGLLRVVGREKGIRLYAVREHASLERVPRLPAAESDLRLDALIDVIVTKYAPVPAATLSMLARRVRYGAPQWQARIGAALTRARVRLAHARVDGVEWYWPAFDVPDGFVVDDRVRLLAPFDPIVWDRKRFELLWGWAYRFEAYTPVPKRKLGYYALPMLWKDDVIGWANASVKAGTLTVDAGYVRGSAPRSRAFTAALEREVEALRVFLEAPRESVP